MRIDMEIFIHKNDQQLGPFSATQVNEMLLNGQITPKDWGWLEGLTEWVYLESFEFIKQNTPQLSQEELERLKIIACLSYMGHSEPHSLTYKEGMKWLGGSLLQEDAKAQAKARERFEKWSNEKLTLHPKLFQKEILELNQKRIDRIVSYLSERVEECEELGIESSPYNFPPSAIEKAIALLDQAKPDWHLGMFEEEDSNEVNAELIEEVFIPTLKKVSS
jgi:hypothetical protein